MSESSEVLRAVMYTRVSTRDRQNPERQSREMKEFIASRKWQLSYELVDKISANKQRPEWEELKRLCRARKVDIVVVHEFTRFARSTLELLQTLQEYRSLGIQFVSLKQQIDTTTPMGKVMFGLLSLLGEFELDILKERVRSGMDARKAELRENGYFISKKGFRRTALGRPRAVADVTYIAQRREQGATWSVIAGELNVSPDTCQRALNGPRGASAAKGGSESVS